jgi:hypothetical protein
LFLCLAAGLPKGKTQCLQRFWRVDDLRRENFAGRNVRRRKILPGEREVEMKSADENKTGRRGR